MKENNNNSDDSISGNDDGAYDSEEEEVEERNEEPVCRRFQGRNRTMVGEEQGKVIDYLMLKLKQKCK
ncbi:7915_t:CDS:2 [Entrophospora sp. SA101]|nr:7915_t:CDS:2 [Entrophospora sp. SA101]